MKLKANSGINRDGNVNRGENSGNRFSYVHSLLILAIDSGSLDELGFDSDNGIGLIVSVKVDSERVNHNECCNYW